MSAKLHLARPEDLGRLLPLVARFHAEEGVELLDDTRESALTPLLAGSPHGAVYLISPRNSPVGYIAVSFGYSIEFGGIDGFIDEFYIREKLRGRGMGSEVLRSLIPALAEHGVKALHLEVDGDNKRARKMYTRMGFAARDRYVLMTQRL